MSEVAVRWYKIYLCDLCVAGAGGECHSPGCALWMNRAPDMALTPMPYGTLQPLPDENPQRESESKETP